MTYSPANDDIITGSRAEEEEEKEVEQRRRWRGGGGRRRGGGRGLPWAETLVVWVVLVESEGEAAGGRDTRGE